MVRALPAIVIIGLLGAFACGGSGGSGQSAGPAATAGTAKVDPATAGSIGGKVAIEGNVPPNAAIPMNSDPVCAGANKDGAKAETFVVDNGGLDNVFVYIKDDLGAKYAFETPKTPVTIEQKGCHYLPHVAGLRVGQPLEISNDDSTMHTVHGMGRSNQEFNFSQPVTGIKNTVSFTTPEVLMAVKCDVHPWMHAFVGVVNHPFFAVSKAGGKFDLKDVPPGTYTVEAVHEKLGSQTQSITIGPKENKEITFTFKAAAS
jgi:hypothetical protein